ncbi:SDR family NAD(P)-dependent oxidoreductase [Candidatus Hepatoplasma crinochetorum]|uniref:Serine 3-dehydrogenase n=1 Tax=Candidatus Hepatoplasma crinochetorum Av TaxID=1427984 RepID=W8GJB1_9MOLU|nr:SDR family NAD(P)-dependent oxidoreductase [Candidatus Hepatoplasma crinochetorum]AHK22332.1 Serine 3-dehydrogenase [Candidatus Hepatoplasma crinochetorum Av]BDV02916.1 MAG: oxidoreductase [Candidatus Hepatoplasma crinochetorum]
MKYTLITGASSGIGKALAEKFAKEGHNLIIAARRTNLLNEIKNQLESKYKIDVIVFTVDLSNSNEIQNFYKNVKKYQIEIFINNAGFGDVNLPWDSDIKKIEKMIDLNIKSLTTLSIMFIKDNLDNDVQLINVSSVAGYSIFSKAISYSASKVFVSSWTESVAKQLRKLNKKIKVKILAPGATESEFNDRALTKTKYNQKQIEEYKNRVNKKSAQELAEETYKLYKSDNILGIIKNNELKMNDGYYDIRWV